MTRVIGLTGGIASGKSTGSGYLQTRGAVILDADAIARDLSRPGGTIYTAYVNHFGRKILQPDGELDRRAIGQMVFGSPAEKEWIDTITHPLIREEMQLRLQQEKEQGAAIILLDVPLLFESGWDKMAEGTCLVYVDESVQLARLMARNGYGRDEALARIRAQMPLSEKKKRAKWLIDNNGDRSAAIEQADRLWKEWTHEGLS